MTTLQASESQPASIERIRQELDAMWASQAAAEEPVIRACTHNLIVFVANEETAASTTQRVIDLTLDRPGRVILIDVEPGREDRVQAWVTTYCRAAGKKQICGELITLAVWGSMREDIHSTVISLLAPDLPVYLWWTCELQPDDHLFANLVKSTDRVLVDSGMFGPLAKGLEIVAGLGEDLCVGDLNWARLTPWRRALAQLWDNRSIRSSLDQIRSLDIHHVAAGDFQDSERALLLAGWLADTLQWELVNARRGVTGGYITEWRKGDWQGKVEIVESNQPGVERGEITGIYLQAGQKPPFVMSRLTLMPDAASLEVRFNEATPNPHRLIRRFDPVTTGRALAEELDLGYDPVYYRAAQQTSKMLAACRAAEEHKDE
jgi:glucose-6-phosphate dehydrogenase assembly protein OpcA